MFYKNVYREVVVVFVVTIEGISMQEEKTDNYVLNKTQTEPFTQVHASP